MKKRAAAAILGILLSVSMGLEVPAAALDGGFTSGFTSEQTGEAQQPDAVEAEQPAVSEPETPSVDGSQQETSDTVQTPQENVSAGESVTDGFTSGSTENGDRTSAENPVQDVQGFENTDETDSFEVQETPEEAADMRASESSTIFEWKEWEQTSDGRFRLHKKKAVKAAVQIADVQSSDVPAEAGSADEQTADEFSDNSEAQDAGKKLVELFGGKAFSVPAEERAAYHAAACICSNYAVAVEAMAAQLMARWTGSNEAAWEALLPLFKGTAANLQATQNPAAVLTGPIARGDVSTVAKHLAALPADVIPAYCSLGLATTSLALANGTIDENAADELRNLLGGYYG